jgi:hypothetical protein
MATPTKKARSIEALLKKMSPGNKDRVESIEGDICVWCEGPAESFTDQLSAKEYTISGFCQSCQDKTFGSPE